MDFDGAMSEFDEPVVFQETESFCQGFRHMEEIRRQGKLCDVVLKVCFYMKALSLVN